MDSILFIAPANSVHSYRWVSFFKKKFNCSWLSYHKVSNEMSLEYKIKNQIIYNIFFSKILQIFSPFYTLYIFLKLKPKIVHIHSLGLNFFVSIILIIFMKKRVIITPWGSDINYMSYLKKLIFKLILKNNYFTTDSFELENTLYNYSSYNKIYKINFGIDTKFYKRDSKKIFSKKKIILCPRGYEKVYNSDLILYFIKSNKEYLKGYKFLFLGNENEKRRIVNLALDLDVENFCHFLNKVSRKKLLNFYKMSDFVISASRSDAGISSAVAEAMCCKKVVLCTYNKDNPFWIDNGKNGFLFLDNDINDFKKTFFNILALSPEEKMKIGENAFMTQEKFNSYDIEMKKVLKLYKTLIKKIKK